MPLSSFSAFEPALAHAASSTEQTMDRLLPHRYPDGGDTGEARVFDAMRYSSLGGGKRLRAFFVLAGATLFKVGAMPALRTASAIEFVHAYSLIHDDLPAMDDDDLRRGKPTCHKQFDQATAILAGDALLTLAFEIVATHPRPAEAVVGCVRVLAEAAGPSGMVGGQMADLEAEGRRDGTPDALEAIHRRKTGALLRAPLRMGAIVAGADAKSRAALDIYGRAIGLAFQIVDDLLDVQGDEAKLGKRVRKDFELGKWTYPGFWGVEGSRQRARQLADEAVEALAPLGAGGDRLRALALDLLERDR